MVEENIREGWNYDMDACPLDMKVYLLSGNSDFLFLSQAEYVGTITHNGRFRTRGECYEGDPDCFYRSAIVAWKPYVEKQLPEYIRKKIEQQNKLVFKAQKLEIEIDIWCQKQGIDVYSPEYAATKAQVEDAVGAVKGNVIEEIYRKG